MISIIVPAYKEQHLQKTIDSLLENAEGEVEVIAVLDGYWQNPPLKEDPRLKILHIGKCRGMRNAINAGVAIAKGEWIMKTDAHCLFSKGYDRLLTEKIQEDWVVIPRRYHLDTEKWAVMEELGFIDYDKLIIHRTRNKFHGEEWRTRTKQRKDVMIDETMSFQGSCWFMSRKWWDFAIVRLEEEGYGTFTQEPIEIGMKTWSKGGKTMINKKTWYAHKHRMFNRSHFLSREEVENGNAYALNLWMDEYLKLKEYFQI